MSVAGTSVNGLATKKKLAEDTQGRKFVQTTLYPNDSLLTPIPDKATDAASRLFTPDEIIAAQKVASFYYAEQVTDSFLKGDGITKADTDLWWDSVKDDVDPEQAQNFVEFLNAPYNPDEIVVYQNPERAAKGYSLVYDENNVQILTRQISYTRVIAEEIAGKKYIGFAANAFFEMPVTKNGERFTEKVTLSGEVATRQTEPGAFKIAGTTLKVDSVDYSK